MGIHAQENWIHARFLGDGPFLRVSKRRRHAKRAKMIVRSGLGPWIQGPWTTWVGGETGFPYSKETTDAPALAGWSSHVFV